ncbi:MAG: hypothetical protein JO235_22595 [Chroococcidiopsidaceae cyanobacterium CP_BM_RX_35]|nr:hypothetical protein [Chroococcidiopsidaceae cyanobacterium CP_BM_RX_35]
MPRAKAVMQPVSNFARLPIYFFLLAELMSCGNLAPPNINGSMLSLGINVTDIRALQRQDNNATVYLQGKVTRLIPLLKQQVYQLQDATDSIWVLTQQNKIRQGDRILVQGKLRNQSVSIAGKDVGEIYVAAEQEYRQ